MYIPLSDDKHQMVRDSSKIRTGQCRRNSNPVATLPHAAVVFHMQPFNEKITETVNTVYICCQDAINVMSCLFNYGTFLHHKHDFMFTALIIKILSHKSRRNSA